MSSLEDKRQDQELTEDEDDGTTEQTSTPDKKPDLNQSIKDGSESIHDRLDENVDIKDEVQDLPDDKDFNRPELCSLLSNLARQEINTNRQMYRSLMCQNLSNHNENWHRDISDVEKVNKIDELIDTSIQVWVDRHIEEFVGEIQDKESNKSIKDIAKLTVGAEIVRRVIERVSSDAIYDYGKEISGGLIQWFLENTPLTPEQLFNAVESMLRALFAV